VKLPSWAIVENQHPSTGHDRGWEALRRRTRQGDHRHIDEAAGQAPRNPWAERIAGKVVDKIGEIPADPM
jgi:hypothetical protein